MPSAAKKKMHAFKKLTEHGATWFAKHAVNFNRLQLARCTLAVNQTAWRQFVKFIQVMRISFAYLPLHFQIDVLTALSPS